MVVCLGVFLVHKVGIVRAYHLDTHLFRHFQHHLIGTLLQRVRLSVGPYMRVFHLVALQLQVVVVAKNAVIPLRSLACAFDVVPQNLAWNLARDARRTNNQSLVIGLQVFAIGSRAHVISVYPRSRNQLYQVLIPLIVLRQHNKVVATHVSILLHLVCFAVSRHIHLTADDRLKFGQPFFFALAVNLFAVVKKLFRAEHVAMIGQCHTAHAVGYGLIHKALYARLSVEYRIICVYVKVNEVFHLSFLFPDEL